MSIRIPNPPPADIFSIDLNPYKPFLIDLPQGAMRGMRTEQDGLPSVIQEITSNQPKLGDRAGITATDFDKFVNLNDQISKVEEQLPRMAKSVEILVESLAHIDNLRHRLAAQFADAAEAHAKAEGNDPTLLTAYEKTIAYRGVIADKAVKTRKKNEEAKKGAGADASAPSNTPAATAAPTATTATTATTAMRMRFLVLICRPL
jgi:regulator of replication initiation timing